MPKHLTRIPLRKELKHPAHSCLPSELGLITVKTGELAYQFSHFTKPSWLTEELVDGLDDRLTKQAVTDECGELRLR